MVFWVEPLSKSSERPAIMVSFFRDTTMEGDLMVVLALAWTRADKNSTYTKLDLMEESAVESFFNKNKVDGKLSYSLCPETNDSCRAL